MALLLELNIVFAIPMIFQYLGPNRSHDCTERYVHQGELPIPLMVGQASAYGRQG